MVPKNSNHEQIAKVGWIRQDKVLKWYKELTAFLMLGQLSYQNILMPSVCSQN